MEIVAHLRCIRCGRTATVTYEPPLGEPLDASAAMAKMAARSGWRLTTVESRFNGEVTKHDLCPECKEANPGMDSAHERRA